jgi:hypothetical protein
MICPATGRETCHSISGQEGGHPFLDATPIATPNAQKKHLLHLLVKKVLAKDRDDVEIWYALPQGAPVRTMGDLVAPTGLEPVFPP